ncbi:MAG: type 1 glutamine amidotransferase [Kiritimatiellia bacterium]|jgi:type 1 glutamine amidotransferase
MKIFVSALSIIFFGLFSLAADPVSPEKIEAILAAAILAAAPHQDAVLSAPRSVRVCWSKADHGKGVHAYKEFAEMMSGLLNKVEHIEAKAIEGFPSDDQWAATDLVVFYLTQHTLSDAKVVQLDQHLKAGKSILVLHQALVQRKNIERWADRIGYAYSFDAPTQSKWGPMDGAIILDPKHEIFTGFPDRIHLKDELYWNLQKGDVGNITVLGRTATPGAGADAAPEWPVFWTVEHPSHGSAKGGRVFCSVVGHIDDLHNTPFFRTILFRGAAWCLREPFAPFRPLVSDGLLIHP